MSDNSYKNRINKQTTRNIREAIDVNTNLSYLIRNMWVNDDWEKRTQETKQTPQEIAEFKRQTKNLEYMAIPPKDTTVYRLQGL